MFASDYLAPFRREEDIADYAAKLRQLAGVPVRLPIDVMAAARFLEGRLLPEKGRLEIRRTDHDNKPTPAFVTFGPLVLHVDRELWDMALLNHPYCRYVIAHELGHVVLHKHGMQPFSGKNQGFTSKGFEGQSAEWQANTFANHFLAPDSLAKLSFDMHDLCNQACIDIDKAESILRSLNKRKLWNKPELIGEACYKCLNFSVKQNKNFIKCMDCGTQTFI